MTVVSQGHHSLLMRQDDAINIMHMIFFFNTSTFISILFVINKTFKKGLYLNFVKCHLLLIATSLKSQPSDHPCVEVSISLEGIQGYRAHSKEACL